MKTTLTVTGLKELQKYLVEMAGAKAKEIKKEVYASALDIQKKAKANLKEMEAWDTGNLANTTLVDRVDNDLGAEIGTTAPYGSYVEHGTKPHFPPPDALEDWARRHGMDSAWPVCKAISERGLPDKPFLFPAYLDVVKGFFDRLKAIFER